MARDSGDCSIACDGHEAWKMTKTHKCLPCLCGIRTMVSRLILEMMGNVEI